MGNTERINWLSILRGMTILLVVMNHTRLLDVSTGDCYSFILDINKCFLPLRMPTFIMVSGALLYYSRISRGWKTFALYKDKLMRIGVPLIFCTVLGNIMQMLFNSFVKHPHIVTFDSFLQSFVLVKGLPWPHRWYLMTLMLIMSLYPLFALKKSKVLDCLLLAVTFILRDIDFHELCSNDWFGLFTVNRYLPYFYLGIVAFKYRWYRYLASWWVTALLIVVYSVIYLSGLELVPDIVTNHFPVCELIGASMIVSISMHIDRFAPKAFKSFSGYIFQIYLFGIAFQAFVELILWRAIGCPNALVVPAFILNIAAGIYMPVVMAKVAERVPYKWIRLCFGLK